MSLGVPFTDLATDFAAVADDVRARFERVLRSQRFVGGDETAELETRLGDLTAAHAVACSSGSDALHLALLAAGVGPGDAVIVPAFSFFSTAGSVLRAGALPVFADVDASTLMLGRRELEATLEARFEHREEELVERSSGACLSAVIVVHLYGRAAPLDELSSALAAAGGPALIEDAAQAIGARADARAVGDGTLVCFSFYPTKNVGAAGDAGAITTSDAALAGRLRRLRNHGAGHDPYVHEECGVNARMAELAAAMVNAKLDRLQEWTAARGCLAAAYDERLAALERRGRLRRPPLVRPPACVWHQYTVRLAHGREEVAATLADDGIETRVFYPVPLHLQPCFANLGYATGALPEAERAAGDVLSLPIHPSLETVAVDRVCDALERAIEDAVNRSVDPAAVRAGEHGRPKAT